ncbi:MAG: hypothetical protein JXR33_09225, partial [Coriobacteriia bacterium]|nr:hypothetical protein [Coriobacteriia bacterium]
MQRQEQGRSLRQVLVKILAVTSGILAVVALLSLGLSLYLWQLSGRLPDMQADLGRLQMAETSIVYAADGTVLAEWYDEQDRTVVASDVLPADLKQA